MIDKTCRHMKIDSPFNSTHYNVKDLCKELYPRLSGGYGMKNALQRVAKVPLEGTHHRGGDDAKNIA
jgi:inhibitor of KinA sporulation pathway (predicted exonuclease)